MRETELFEPVKAFLMKTGCTEVYGEVANYDVLGIQGVVNTIVEMKTTLSFKVIDQALYARTAAQYVYIAVPHRKGELPCSVREILTANKIGLLYIKDGRATVQIPARFNRVANRMRGERSIRRHIRSFQHELVGGVKSGEKKTDYSVTMENIQRYLRFNRRGRWTTVDDILLSCETHYANPRPSVMATLKEKWNQDWVEMRKTGRKLEFRYKPEADSEQSAG